MYLGSYVVVLVVQAAARMLEPMAVKENMSINTMQLHPRVVGTIIGALGGQWGWEVDWK